VGSSIRVGTAVVVCAFLVLVSGGAAAAAGDLDPSFGSGGKVSTSFGANTLSFATGVGVMSDGRIVAAGTTGNQNTGDQDFGVIRYKPDGSLDSSFGNGGVVKTDLGTNTDEGRATVLQPDGKIVVVGITQAASQIDDLVIVRYNVDGSLDSSFGSGGIVRVVGSPSFSTEINAVVLQPDGKIVVGGGAYSTIPQCCAGLTFFLARFNPDGSPDSSFGNNGQAEVSFGSDQTSDISSLALQPDGKIVAAGESSPSDNSTSPGYAVARVNGEGSPDQRFGTGGVVQSSFNDTNGGATSVAVQADGKIVVAGSRTGAGSVDFGLLRLNADGSVDSGFGNGGTVVTDLNSGSYDNPMAVAIESDGKILAAGYGYTSMSDFAVVRYKVDGSLDSSFGSGGIAHTAFTSEGNNYANAMAIQSDGNVVLAGQVLVESPLSNGFGVARFLNPSDTTAPTVTGSPDRPANANGWYSSPAGIHWTATDPDDASVPQPPDTTAATEGANVSYTSAQSCDAAGNCASGSYSVSLDETAPTFNCATPDTVWHAADVSLACTASDRLSGLANSGDGSFSLTTSVPADTETANATTRSRSVCDLAGNCTSVGPVSGIKVDKKPPQITLTTPAAGAVYTYRQPVTAGFACVDGGSGTGSPGFCTGTPLSGSNISTTTPGANTFTVSSADAVGNAATAVSHAYSVHFAFGGFYAPLRNPPTYINVVQSGKGVPIPFSLRDYAGASVFGTFGLAIFTGSGPSSAAISCPAAATKNNVSQTTLTGLRYISSSGQYEYDWPTSTSWRGTCRALTLKFKDGTSQTVNFQLK